MTNHKPSRAQLSRLSFVMALMIVCVAVAMAPGAEPPLMKWSTMEKVTKEYLSTLPPRPYRDLVLWEDLSPLLDEIQRKGWAMPYRRHLSDVMVKQSDFLARFAASESGGKWLTKSAGQSMLLDRVDRISRVEHGERTLQDVAKLPNGSKFAGTKAKSFMPSLIDMLPLKGGKKAVVPDYEKPTGRMYTQQQVLEYMGRLHAASEKYFNRP